MKNVSKTIFFLFSVLLFYTSCTESNAAKYKKMEERELATNERNDSLFLGIYLGMPSQDFYTHCWEMSKKGIIKEGAENTSVLYKIKDLNYPVNMDFYPGFYEGKILEMPVVFAYESWAPWNKHLFADSLQVEVLDLMEEWYGQGFLEITNPKNEENKAFVKVDGNRRISVYKMNDTKVRVDFIDLRKAREIDKLKDPKG